MGRAIGYIVAGEENQPVDSAVWAEQSGRIHEYARQHGLTLEVVLGVSSSEAPPRFQESLARLSSGELAAIVVAIEGGPVSAIEDPTRARWEPLLSKLPPAARAQAEAVLAAMARLDRTMAEVRATAARVGPHKPNRWVQGWLGWNFVVIAATFVVSGPLVGERLSGLLGAMVLAFFLGMLFLASGWIARCAAQPRVPVRALLLFAPPVLVAAAALGLAHLVRLLSS